MAHVVSSSLATPTRAITSGWSALDGAVLALPHFDTTLTALMEPEAAADVRLAKMLT